MNMSDLNPCMWNRAQQAALILTVLLCSVLGVAVGMAAAEAEALDPAALIQDSDAQHVPELRAALER
jgi:hypothetical protein